MERRSPISDLPRCSGARRSIGHCPDRPDLPYYLGSDLHISQGLEIGAWGWDAPNRRLGFSLRRPGPASGQIELALPRPPTTASINGEPLEWFSRGQDRYLFELQFNRSTLVNLEL